MNSIIKQAKQYRIDSTYTGRAHYKAGDLSIKYNNRLGIPVIFTTAIVGTSIFATINESPQVKLRILAGIIIFLATILSTLQTFFKFSEKAEKHRIAGAKYGSIRREIDLFLIKYSEEKDDDRKNALSELELIAKQLSTLASESPRIPDKAFSIAINEIESEKGVLQTSVARVEDDN